MIKYTIGIDLGGTFIKIGLIRSGKILHFTVLPADSEKGLRINLPKIKDAINNLLHNNEVHISELAGISLAFPGIVDVKHCLVLATNEKYDDACELNLQLWCELNWGVPFYMDNDTRMATVGEWECGAARGLDNVVMMTIGTGIGTGVILDGRVLYGEHYQAGSLGGHFVVDYKGRKCSCGNVGCVEALSSSFFLSSIIKDNTKLTASFRDKADCYDFEEIFSLASRGDIDALLVRNECMDVWSAAIVTYIHAYDPQVIVLGGGIMKSKDVILPYIRERVERLAWCPTEKVKIVASELGDNAAVLAAEYSFTSKRRKNEILSA